MTSGSWPYMPGQCPKCVYLHAEGSGFVDDSGYEILGLPPSPDRDGALPSAEAAGVRVRALPNVREKGRFQGVVTLPREFRPLAGHEDGIVCGLFG